MVLLFACLVMPGTALADGPRGRLHQAASAVRRSVGNLLGRVRGGADTRRAQREARRQNGDVSVSLRRVELEVSVGGRQRRVVATGQPLTYQSTLLRGLPETGGRGDAALRRRAAEEYLEAHPRWEVVVIPTRGAVELHVRGEDGPQRLAVSQTGDVVRVDAPRHGGVSVGLEAPAVIAARFALAALHPRSRGVQVGERQVQTVGVQRNLDSFTGLRGNVEMLNPTNARHENAPFEVALGNSRVRAQVALRTSIGAIVQMDRTGTTEAGLAAEQIRQSSPGLGRIIAVGEDGGIEVFQFARQLYEYDRRFDVQLQQTGSTMKIRVQSSGRYVHPETYPLLARAIGRRFNGITRISETNGIARSWDTSGNPLGR